MLNSQLTGLATLRAGAVDESEEDRYRALLHAPVPVMLFDDTGRVHLLSQAWLKLTGYGSEELRTIEDWAARAGDEDIRTIPRPTGATTEFSVKTKDGRRRDWSFATSPFGPSAEGRHLFICIANDVTERKRSEETLRERERWFRALLEALPAALYTTDAAGRITFYNQAAVDLWGHRPELGESEWCGSWRLYWPDGTPMPHDRCPMAVTLKENRPIRGAEAVAERPDGRRVPFLAYPTPLRDDSGALVGAVNMLVDGTEQKASADSARRLVSIVESSDDAIASKNLDGIIETWNQGAERLFGYTAEEVIGKPVTILIPQDRHDEEPGILERIRRGERLDHYETVRRRKDGSLIEISLTVSPIKNAEGKIIGASKIARDITERKRAEENMKLLMREIDHRARNLLATVQAITQMTKADTVPAFVEALTGRLLALSRVHTLLAESRWTGADLRRLVEEELAAFAGGDGGRVRVSGPEVALCSEAAQVIAMAIHELATNAAKYGALSAPRGRVAAEWSWASDERLVLRWTEAGGPPVRAPSHRGFGTGLFEAAITGQLGGEARFDWRAEGLACEIGVPGNKLVRA